ncbi:hypothetical protein LCGC14_1128620, partial [marine sediment metagenome]
MNLKPSVVAEQDKWLSYVKLGRVPTHEERMEFLHFDSQGGVAPTNNPIYQGKVMAGRIASDGWLPAAEELLTLYEAKGWPGGIHIMVDYLRRVDGIAPLRKVFGDSTVHRWLQAFLEMAIPM